MLCIPPLHLSVERKSTLWNVFHKNFFNCADEILIFGIALNLKLICIFGILMWILLLVKQNFLGRRKVVQNLAFTKQWVERGIVHSWACTCTIENTLWNGDCLGAWLVTNLCSPNFMMHEGVSILFITFLWPDWLVLNYCSLGWTNFYDLVYNLWLVVIFSTSRLS